MPDDFCEFMSELEERLRGEVATLPKRELGPDDLARLITALRDWELADRVRGRLCWGR